MRPVDGYCKTKKDQHDNIPGSTATHTHATTTCKQAVDRPGKHGFTWVVEGPAQFRRRRVVFGRRSGVDPLLIELEVLEGCFAKDRDSGLEGTRGPATLFGESASLLELCRIYKSRACRPREKSFLCEQCQLRDWRSLACRSFHPTEWG